MSNREEHSGDVSRSRNSGGQGPADGGYRRDRDDRDSSKRYDDRDSRSSRRYEDDYRRDRGERDRGGRYDGRRYEDDRRRDPGRGYDRDREGDSHRGSENRTQGSNRQPPSAPRQRSRSPVRPLDKRSIEEGRRQREAERAQRAQRGESVHSADNGRASTPGTVPPIPGQGPSSGARRGTSPAPYRRPRNGRGEHLDTQRTFSGQDAEGDESVVKQEDDNDREEGEEEEEEGGEEDAMAAMLGFGGFGSTKNQKVTGNVEGAATIKTQRTWRQYMNRRGGFNRPLDPVKAPKMWH